MKYVKRAAVILGIVIVSGSLLALAALFLIHREVQGRTDELRAAQRSELAALRERVLEDQRVLAGHWLFGPGGGGGDASVVLCPRAGWRGRGVDQAGDPGVPTALVAQVKDWGPDWATHAVDVDLTGVDLAWMKELPRYDHWDLEAEGSPLNTPPWRWHDAPIPDFVPLQAAAKVRLLQGIRAGAPAEAVAEVRALARLCASTEMLIGEMIAAALMGIERKARLAAGAQGLDLTAWPTITEEEVQQVQRTLWGAVAFFQPIALETGATTPVADAIQVGRCAALLEGGANTHFLGQFLGARYDERTRVIGDAIARSPCRLKNLRRVWNGTDGEGQLVADDELFCTVSMEGGGERPPGCDALGAILWLPWTKAAIGETLLSIASPGYLQKYAEAPESAPPPTSTP
jgi:hypothetical protein